MVSKRRLQVFVSSTYSDLIEERQAAVSAILKAGHIPAGMELFTAGDQSQLTTIYKWIDESDCYILILGGRYGSIEPTTGLSYTELEYDYASKQGKPLFAVVTRDDALAVKAKKIGLSVVEQSEPKALKLFREKVLSNISSFFSDEKDVKLCVFESLSDIRDNPNVVGWVPASEIEDTKPLHEEIAKLKSEIEKLRVLPVQPTQAQPHSNASSNQEKDNELINLLDGTEINIPAKLAGGKEDIKRTFLDIFSSNSNTLVNGVTNSYNSNDTSRFYYHSIFPKLIVFGLASNEKVPGGQFRRSFVNSAGIKLLAEIERRIKKVSDPTENSEVSLSSEEESKEGNRKPKERRKRSTVSKAD